MIILSCRHEVDDFDHAYNIMVKSVDRTGEKALGYMTVCGSCEDGYRQHGQIFDTEHDAYEWLNRGKYEN